MSLSLVSEPQTNLKLVPIPIPHLGATMAQWVPFVASIAKEQRCFIEQRLGEIFKGEVAPLLIMDGDKPKALILYMIIQRGPDKIFRYQAFGGEDWEKCFELNDTVEKWAREAGCAGMAAMTRPAWAPQFKKWGYRLTHVLYEKDFNVTKHDHHGRPE